MLNFYEIFSNILGYSEFFDLFEVFRIKLLSTARHKHVICIIRFAMKFRIEQSLCGHWAWLGKNGFISKTIRKFDFTRVEIAWVNSKSNKPTLKSIPKSPDNKNSNWAKFHEKTPTHISATYAITIFYQNF